MTRTPRLAILLLALTGATSFAEPAMAPTQEPPAQLDPVEVTAEKRAEVAFRQVQIALRRGRSDRLEDADLIVCQKMTVVGSHVPLISCATNRYWGKVRARSLQYGLSGVESSGGPAADFSSNIMDTGANLQRGAIATSGASGSNGAARSADDKVVSIKLSDYYKLQKRFGELPPELRAEVDPD